MLAAVGACSSKTRLPDDRIDSVSVVSTPGANGGQVAGDTPEMSRMGGADISTGDPDRDFLRMMSDHHSGLLALAHPTLQSKEAVAVVKEDARKMDKAQDAEIKRMVSMLDKLYKDSYTPEVTPDNQRMADELKGKSGIEYNRTFLQDVITHHQQAIKMVDEYLPKAKNADIKAMAVKMKSDQTKEIAALTKQRSTLK